LVDDIYPGQSKLYRMNNEQFRIIKKELSFKIFGDNYNWQHHDTAKFKKNIEL